MKLEHENGEHVAVDRAARPQTTKVLAFGKKAQAREVELRRAAALARPAIEPLLTVADAAAYLRLSKDAVYARVERGQLPCLRLRPGKKAAIRFTHAMLVDSLRHESIAVTTGRALRDGESCSEQAREPGWVTRRTSIWPVPGHEPIGKSKTLPTRAKAKAWGDAEEQRVYDDMKAGRLGASPGSSHLGRVRAAFVDEHARANRHKASGIEDKESILRTHLIPRFGDLRLDQIDTASVQRLRWTWPSRRRARRPCENILTVLRKLLRVAVEWEVLDEMPCKIARTKVSRKAAAFYTFAEYERLVGEAEAGGRDPHLIVLFGGLGGPAARGDARAAVEEREVRHAMSIVVEASDWWGVVDGTKGMREQVRAHDDRGCASPAALPASPQGWCFTARTGA